MARPSSSLSHSTTSKHAQKGEQEQDKNKTASTTVAPAARRERTQSRFMTATASSSARQQAAGPSPSDPPQPKKNLPASSTSSSSTKSVKENSAHSQNQQSQPGSKSNKRKTTRSATAENDNTAKSKIKDNTIKRNESGDEKKKKKTEKNATEKNETANEITANKRRITSRDDLSSRPWRTKPPAKATNQDSKISTGATAATEKKAPPRRRKVSSSSKKANADKVRLSTADDTNAVAIEQEDNQHNATKSSKASSPSPDPVPQSTTSDSHKVQLQLQEAQLSSSSRPQLQSSSSPSMPSQLESYTNTTLPLSPPVLWRHTTLESLIFLLGSSSQLLSRLNEPATAIGFTKVKESIIRDIVHTRNLAIDTIEQATLGHEIRLLETLLVPSTTTTISSSSENTSQDVSTQVLPLEKIQSICHDLVETCALLERIDKETSDADKASNKDEATRATESNMYQLQLQLSNHRQFLASDDHSDLFTESDVIETSKIVPTLLSQVNTALQGLGDARKIFSHKRRLLDLS